jgi:hypothetical protein
MARELRQVRAHVARAERAVDADAERLRVLDRDVEGVERLARQRAAAAVGDRDRDHQRQAHARAPRTLLDRDDAALAFSVSKIVSSSSRSTPPSISRGPALVGVAHLVERHRAERRIVDVGRDRQRPVGRADRAGDEARPVGRRAVHSSAASRASRARRRSARRRAPRARSRPARWRCALNVLVSMMSAPASRYSRWMAPMTSGRVSTSTSLLPLAGRADGPNRSPRKSASVSL